MIRLGGHGLPIGSVDPFAFARAHRAFGYGAAYCPPVAISDSARLADIEKAFAAENVTKPIPDGLDVHQVPAANWAIFESHGPVPTALQTVWKRIFSEFFPSTGYEHAEGLPELEVYPQGDVAAADYVCEVWIPIVKKA